MDFLAGNSNLKLADDLLRHLGVMLVVAVARVGPVGGGRPHPDTHTNPDSRHPGGGHVGHPGRRHVVHVVVGGGHRAEAVHGRQLAGLLPEGSVRAHAANPAHPGRGRQHCDCGLTCLCFLIMNNHNFKNSNSSVYILKLWLQVSPSWPTSGLEWMILQEKLNPESWVPHLSSKILIKDFYLTRARVGA